VKFLDKKLDLEKVRILKNSVRKKLTCYSFPMHFDSFINKKVTDLLKLHIDNWQLMSATGGHRRL
jgi:hypothetical protein